MRQRTSGPDAALPLILVLVMLLAIGSTGFILASQSAEISLPRQLLSPFQPAAQSRPIDGAAPVAPVSLDTEAQVAETAQPVVAAQFATATAETHTAAKPADLAVGARARVANTDNLGVVLYSAPRDNARQPAGLLEGTAVTILERSGDEWARVQSDSKKSGWVRAQYLVPAD